MVSVNHPIESFFDPIQVVKNAFSPLETGIRKAAKDLEHCWPGLKNGTGNNLELIMSHVNGGGGKNDNKVGLCSVKKMRGQCVVNDEKQKGLSIKVTVGSLLGMFSKNHGSNTVDVSREVSKEKDSVKQDGTGMNCLHFSMTWSLLLNVFFQAFPSPFKTSKKKFRKMSNEDKIRTNLCPMVFKSRNEIKQKELQGQSGIVFLDEGVEDKDGRNVSLDCFIGFFFDKLTQNLDKLDLGVHESDCKRFDPSPPSPTFQFDHWKTNTSTWEGKREDVNGFLGNLNFARLGGVFSTIVGVTSSVKEDGDDGIITGSLDDSGESSPQKLDGGLLSIPLSNVEQLRSTLSTVALTELNELVPQLGRHSEVHPDKKKLVSAQDFFRYTESEGRRFFEELDRDGDGQVTLEDLEVAVRKRKLPRRYAREFMHHTRSHLFSKSFGWKQFLSLMEQKEPTILRAYTSLCLTKSGTLQKGEILASLEMAGLPANEDNAVAMMRSINSDFEESISYGHFRNFMLLLPSDRLQEDPRSIWFEAATVVSVAPPVKMTAGSVLNSALAGGLSCALSTFLMHPVDTIKTRVQASTLTFPEIMSKLPQIGIQELYRGSTPAIIGQFSGHALRTGICEAIKLVLINVAPTLPDIHVQSVSSICSTFLGTVVRIPSEVLKQRLQAGIFDNLGEAIVGTWQQDGLEGFFRGTGATLFREVPFYVAGMGLYAKSKKVVQQILGRNLEPWETIAVGAISGGLTAVLTTPFDVVKTRMMITKGQHVSMSKVAFSIIHHEGPLALFKGAIPRFIWVAPLGAMNFAGYELSRKAMDKFFLSRQNIDF